MYCSHTDQQILWGISFKSGVVQEDSSCPDRLCLRSIPHALCFCAHMQFVTSCGRFRDNVDWHATVNLNVELSNIDKQIRVICRLDGMDFTVMSARSSVAFLNIFRCHQFFFYLPPILFLFVHILSRYWSRHGKHKRSAFHFVVEQKS